MFLDKMQHEIKEFLPVLVNDIPGIGMAYCCRNDSDSTMEFVSYGCFNLTGYQPLDLIHNNKVSYAQLINPQDRESAWNEVQAALREKRPYKAIYRITTASGKKKWVLDQGKGFFSLGRKFLILEGFVTDITEQKRTEERIKKINSCFLEFGANPDENINRLTALCGELMGASCAVYNCIDNSMLFSKGRWNTPPDYKYIDKPDGHICYDVIRKGEDLITVLRNLPQTVYFKTDPNIKRYDLQTYIGCPVKFCGVIVGSLCVLYQKDFLPSEEDRRLMGIISCAIGVEEERSHAADALKESEEHYRVLAEAAHDIIFIVDRTGCVKYVNSFAAKQLGFHPQDVIGKQLEDIFPSQVSYLQKGNLEKVIEHARPVYFEDKIPFKSGNIWLGTWLVPLSNRIGRTSSCMGISRDITERKDMEDALRDSELKFRALVETITSGIAILQDNKLLYVNSAIENITGFSRDELLKINFWDRVHPDYREEAQKIVLARQRGEQVPSHFEFKILTKDKQERWIDSTARPMVMDGRPALVVTVFDITERKHTEDMLKKSEERYRGLIEFQRDLIGRVDFQGRLVLVNDAYCNKFGRKREELIGSIFAPLAENGDAAVFLEKIRFSSKRIFKEERLLTPLGWRWIFWEIYPIKDELSGLAEIQVVGRDITDRKRAEDEVLEWKRNMEGTVQALAIASEIRDPYTSGHERRVAQLACAIAKKMDFSDFQIEGIRVASILHDIGKISVPAEILSRPGKISEHEFNIIKLHPNVGYEILKNVDFSWPIPQIILQHHERINGSGYPLGLKGSSIRPEAKILGVADVVEAMSSHRPYRPALGVEKAMEEIWEHKGILYDDKVVDVCKEIFINKEFQFE